MMMVSVQLSFVLLISCAWSTTVTAQDQSAGSTPDGSVQKQAATSTGEVNDQSTATFTDGSTQTPPSTSPDQSNDQATIEPENGNVTIPKPTPSDGSTQDRPSTSPDQSKDQTTSDPENGSVTIPKPTPSDDNNCAGDDPSCTTNTTPESSTNKTVKPDQLQRDEIKCVIENHLSSDGCRKTVKLRANDDSDIKEGCFTLEMLYQIVKSLECTYDDYDNLHAVICTWDGSTICLDNTKMQRENIETILGQVSVECGKAVNAQIKTESLFDYCVNLTKAKDSLIGSKNCLSSEVDKLEAAVCCVGDGCFENTVDISTREGQVITAIRKISPRCKKTLLFASTELSQPPAQACDFLKSTKPALLGSGICTEKDYSDAQKVVCNPFQPVCTDCTTTPDPLENEKAQRANIRDVIGHLKDEKCQNFMLQQASSQASDPLDKTCKVFLDNRPFIVIGGMCLEKDYDNLKIAICGNAGFLSVNLAVIVTFILFVFVIVS